MSGNRILADTNILLYYLQGDDTVISLLEDKRPVISFITELELLSYPLISSTEEGNIKGLLSHCEIININQPLKDLAISIRRQSRLKLPDAIIAATAFHQRVPLVSADKAFEKVSELNFILYEV